MSKRQGRQHIEGPFHLDVMYASAPRDRFTSKRTVRQHTEGPFHVEDNAAARSALARRIPLRRMLEAILAVEVEHADDLSDLLDDSPSKA